MPTPQFDLPASWDMAPILRWPREMTKNRQSSPFRSTWASTKALAQAEVRHLGGRNVELQIAVRPEDLRFDGRLRAGVFPMHPGVILTFTTAKGDMSFPADRFTKWQDNVRAIAMTLERLRAVDRYGVTNTGEQYAGWLELEAGDEPNDDDLPVTVDGAWELIYLYAGTSPTEPMPYARLLRRAQHAAHPDTGGTARDWRRLAAAQKLVEAD